MASILSFNLTLLNSGALNACCRKLGIAVREIPAAAQGMSLGTLCGISAGMMEKTTVIKPFTDEMLVMCGMDSDAIDAFLNAWKKTGMPPIRLKAVLTPFNVTWTASHLHDELSQEAARMNG